jgi:hypothetical protein
MDAFEVGVKGDKPIPWPRETNMPDGKPAMAVGGTWTNQSDRYYMGQMTLL